MPKIIVIDNYDSFVYNLVHLVSEVSGIEPVVVRNNRTSVEEVSKFDKILLSPGPGIPCEAGIMPRIISELKGSHSLLGVCLGHQAIGEAFGGKLINLEQVCHGQELETLVVDNEHSLFRGVPERFNSARYHSWVVSELGLPECLKIPAVYDSGRIMALRHLELPVWGVQFHPESVMTRYGYQMISNWIDS